MCLITRAAGIPTVINIDGLDSDRRKWPRLAKGYLRAAERTAPRWADEAITDSHAVADVFERRYGQRIGVVPYGVEDPGYDGERTLLRLGLEPDRYVLFVGRLEPENNPHVLVEAFSRIDAARARGMKLVIVGGAPYADEYIRQVMREADPRVVSRKNAMGRGVLGRQMLAYGGNPSAAELSGIATGRVVVAAHALSGVLAALAGMLVAARLQAGQPSIGDDWLIVSFAAPVLGGADLSGGHVSVAATALGVLVVSLINNALVLFGVDPFFVQLFLGALILAAVGLNRLREVRAKALEARA